MANAPAWRNIGHRPASLETSRPGIFDTVTVYLGKARSNLLIDEIVVAKPRRIIMNPGAENPPLAQAARKIGIEVVEDCTPVMLRWTLF